jgi:type IV secretion system protein VirB11
MRSVESRDHESALVTYTRPLTRWLADPAVTEICVQRPGQVWVERSDGWQCEEAVWATLTWAQQFARLVATRTEQRVGAESPLLSASLPTGERLQFVLPPATAPGCVVLSVRRPTERRYTLADLARGGAFDACATTTPPPPGFDALQQAYRRCAWQEFLALAVKGRLNVLVAGATGSGKTTLTKALIREIPPDERLISIEDAAELDLASHPNAVHLYYSKDDQGRARVTAKQLLEASLRLRPDRILLAELRGEEAYHFLRNVSSGHPGSITSVHAGSVDLAIEQVSLLVRESAAGRDLSLRDVRRLLQAVLDVVVYCAREGDRRVVRTVWWRAATNQSRYAADGAHGASGCGI